MKNLIIAGLTVTTVALGVWCATQQERIKGQSAQVARDEAELAAVKAEMQKQGKALRQSRFAQAQANILQQRLTESAASAAEQTNRTRQLQQSLDAARTNNPAGAFGAMFRDPKFREMMKSQQKAFLGPVLDQQYKALFQQLNLTPDQTAALRDLLSKRMLAGTDAGLSILDNNLDASQRADRVKQVKAQTEDFENQLKQLLGDENYPAFQAYEKSIPDRIVIGQFADQLAGTPTALTPEQQQHLIQAMGEVRNNFKWTVDLSRSSSGGGDPTAMFSEENVNSFAREKEQLDQQTLARVKPMLTTEQLAAFQDFQNSQRNLQVAGMRMAAQMFAPKHP